MKAIRIFLKFRLEIVSFIVGAVILSYELTASRIVAPYIGATIYTWTSVIGVILAALAAGYAVGGIVADRRKSTNDIVWLLLGSALALIIVNISKDWVLNAISQMNVALRWQALLASILLFTVPTFLLGMIAPYLARLSITKLSSSGSSLARISAAGTLGSLFGTFITGYFLFSVLGSRYILTWLSISIILSSFILSLKFALLYRLPLLLFAFSMLVYSPHATIPNASVVDDLDTAYSRVIINDRILDNRPIRVLQTDNASWQSGVYQDGSKDLVFSYTRAFAEVYKSQPKAKNVLIIGGGSFSFPEYAANAYPDAKIDVVEIDPALTKVGKEYFNFRQPINLNIINQDGRQFLNDSDEKYDLIFIDAFSSFIPPFQLMTKQAVEKVKSNLSQDGVVALNVISAADGKGSKLSGAIASTYESVFKNATFYQVDANFPKSITQNLLLIASVDKLNSSVDTNLKLSGAGIFHSRDKPSSFTNSKVLTDDFAPVEHLSIQENF